MKREMLKTIKANIGSETAKDSSFLLVGNMFSALFAIIFTIIGARFLGPVMWGIASVVISFVAIVNSVGDLGLGASLFRFMSKEYAAGDYEKAHSILNSIFVLRVLSALIIFLIILVLSPQIAKDVFIINEPRLPVIAGIAAVSYLFFDFQVFEKQSQRKFLISALLIASSNFLRIILLLLLYIFKALELVSLLLIFAISPLIVFVLFFKRAGQKFNFSDLRANTKLIKSFSGTMGLNRILAVINGRVDIFIMIHFLTAFDTGVFAAAKQVALGVPLVIGSFATVLAPRFSNLKGEKLRKYFNKTIVLSFIISLGIMVGLVVSPLVVYLFGNEYKASLPVLRLLLISFIPFALSTPFVNLLIYGFGKPGLISIMTIFQIAALFAGNLLFVPRFGILTPAYVQIFINLASLTASFSLVQYYLNKKI